MQRIHAAWQAQDQLILLKSHIVLDAWPCSEDTLLDLQDIFLTPGIHGVHVSSLEAGRAMMRDMLAALKCFQKVVEINAMTAVDWRFFCDENIDFIWMENRQKQSIADDLHQCVIDCSHSMPVIIIEY